ncbi:hypothetical protein E2562_036979 [Oryza meyeriana var. granulata]|uniref:Uncharacterized protein n=1 Tax=Oryza meyeriana var. granulata TaxID=110450 RepID=A0A6G1F220_9ORYZ|nr:hypothetical protein E2562_036979 [Oryza meyeriana var. granulata]
MIGKLPNSVLEALVPRGGGGSNRRRRREEASPVGGIIARGHESWEREHSLRRDAVDEVPSRRCWEHAALATSGLRSVRVRRWDSGVRSMRCRQLGF